VLKTIKSEKGRCHPGAIVAVAHLFFVFIDFFHSIQPHTVRD
jgi:hypothetical protein